MPVAAEGGAAQEEDERIRTAYEGYEVQGSRWVRGRYNFCETPLFVRENTILVQGQEEGEGGFGYDWLKSGGVIKLYGARPGAKAVLVDTEGTQVGVLELDGDGELAGMDLLEGDWRVERFG